MIGIFPIFRAFFYERSKLLGWSIYAYFYVSIGSPQSLIPQLWDRSGYEFSEMSGYIFVKLCLLFIVYLTKEYINF